MRAAHTRSLAPSACRARAGAGFLHQQIASAWLGWRCCKMAIPHYDGLIHL
jgi:hypothetical protein